MSLQVLEGLCKSLDKLIEEDPSDPLTLKVFGAVQHLANRLYLKGDVGIKIGKITDRISFREFGGALIVDINA